MKDQKFSATFETWIVKKDNALLSEIPGRFTVEIRLVSSGSGRKVGYRYHAHIGTVLNQFAETFAESKLGDCKAYIRDQFKRQVSDWEAV